MKCDICGMREAAVFIQRTGSNGKVSEMHLCTSCAREKGFEAHGQRIEMSLNRMMKDFAERRECSVCGQTLEDIKKYQRVGCPNCYKDFAIQIKAILKKGDESLAYEGTVPQLLGRGRPLLETRAILQKKLDNAVANEDYEKAAVYRDRIRELDVPEDAAAELRVNPSHD